MKLKNILKKILLTFLFLIISVIVVVLLINIYIVGYSKKYILNEKEIKDKYECIIVLGASVRRDGTPSLMLKDRLDKSIELYNKKIAPKILMSGDHASYGYDEVGTMKRYAVEKDINTSDIFVDHYGINTYDSMYRLKHIFKVKKTMIVTQKYHLYRAIFIARKLGIDAYGVETKKINYTGQTHREIREILARIKAFINVIKKPESTYLGDTISVSGDGDITNNRQ